MANFSSARGDMRDDSRPTTPTAYSRAQKAHPAMRALNTRPTQQETFFDDSTPVDNFHNGDQEFDITRDSHDLSFSDGTRDSVVDNMLLSLDQLTTSVPPTFTNAPAQYSNYDDDDFFLTSSHYNPPRPRIRGHTQTSSSSDYDIHFDDASSRYSRDLPRGRRSNSSSNFQMLPSRKESLRGGYTSSRDKQSKGIIGDFGSSGHARGQGKKGSKSSGSSSLDFGYSQVLGTHRLTFGNRSASFDHGSVVDRPRISPVKGESILDRGRPTYPSYDYDAAPEPTIPAGPRRMLETAQPSPLFPIQPTFTPPQASAPHRKNSVQSSTRTLRKNKSQPEPNMRLQAQEFVNAQNLRDMPALPIFQDAPAPPPSVNMRKPVYPPQSTPASTPKDKPGFFRRVFGGSLKSQQQQLSNASTNSYSSQQDTPPTSNRPGSAIDSQNATDSQRRPRTTPSNSNHIASQLKSYPKVPQTSNSTEKETQKPVQPTLAKKPSSFFRRRKKSISEAKPLPVMKLNFKPPTSEVMLPAPSPGISSLRQVMHPYLNDPGSPERRNRELQTPERELANEQHPTRFSPGYKPHKDATVRSVKQEFYGAEGTTPASRDQQAVRNQQFLNTDSPKLKLKMKRGPSTNVNSDPHDDSFLVDSSSCNEERSDDVTPEKREKRTRRESDGNGRPKTSPLLPSMEVEEVHRSANDQNSNRDLTPTTVEKRSGEKPSPQQQTLDNARANMAAAAAAIAATGIPVSDPSTSASEYEEDGWIVTAPTKQEQTSHGREGSKSRRVWLHPSPSEENLGVSVCHETGLSLPLEGANLSISTSQPSLDKTNPASARDTGTTPSSATSDVFHTPLEANDQGETMPSILQNSLFSEEQPTDADRDRAMKIFNGDEGFVNKAQAAALLGDITLTATRTRKAYLDLFDWTGMNILQALRDLCTRLVLKAESQQVDRILTGLSERWCECNPNHGFKAVDVVHTICYSLLLLNTDLHMADIESRMTKNQFVKNTLPTVRRVCTEAIKENGDDTIRPMSTQVRGAIPWDRSEPNSPAPTSPLFPPEVSEEPPEARRARSRLSLKPPIRIGSEGLLDVPDSNSGDKCAILVNSPYRGPMRGWEEQIEVVLKDFYSSIRQQRLPLHGAPGVRTHDAPSTNNLSVTSMLRRTPSVLSKAPSDSVSYRGRGSQTDFRSVGARWQSKTRSRGRLYPASTVASSRTSLDDQSVWSPAGSSTWSKYSFGKTQTSMSMESFGSHFAHGDYQQAIGFANALSQAIIREEGAAVETDEEFTRVAPLLEDESLELIGAPWAKEGILKHKHHLESVDKKAKDRSWNECFAVIEKGYMRLFSFNANAKSLRNKNKSRPSGGVVGGGNWMDNAEALDTILLRQTIASALPPPGYSKSRPHVWALSLPTGAVHLFQVGTPDIIREFVSTANYWSARLSKEPLIGGVSNIEYGWGEGVINPALIPRRESNPPAHGHVHRPSVTSSIRSSVDQATGTVKARLPGDKVSLAEWSPPVQSMMASNLLEVDQLKALSDYVKSVEDELAHHQELRAPMLIAFSPRHPNAAKAMANWERKSSYLLREIVKFRTYIDSLNGAQTAKEKIYAEREAEAAKQEAHVTAGSVMVELDGAVDGPKSMEHNPSPSTTAA
ncbi:hypothetical protein GQ43DRAFT_33252 [Delitschia confertaspora ATCC 74209]|uniref:SEC7 domain-containing protein n=1 Tax=Delitschia confertaspora ATCC 74209 TaxID=1513339 RepID=A0A9P4JM01_9PLEO|nr:hypothetical protein GQ43DRAFT_33252 [Delitschia confertaspora ATCC 74209]